jgi:hypothetical protein
MHCVPAGAWARFFDSLAQYNSKGDFVAKRGIDTVEYLPHVKAVEPRKQLSNNARKNRTTWLCNPFLGIGS